MIPAAPAPARPRFAVGDRVELVRRRQVRRGEWLEAGRQGTVFDTVHSVTVPVVHFDGTTAPVSIVDTSGLRVVGRTPVGEPHPRESAGI